VSGTTNRPETQKERERALGDKSANVPRKALRSAHLVYICKAVSDQIEN
jgi:hypothetical protein